METSPTAADDQYLAGLTLGTQNVHAGATDEDLVNASTGRGDAFAEGFWDGVEDAREERRLAGLDR